MDLLARWIDDPSDELSEQIRSLTFADKSQPDLDPHRVVWWALRTATSSVGNFEAGWALEATCNAAVGAGFSPEQLRGIAERELLSRMSRPK